MKGLLVKDLLLLKNQKRLMIAMPLLAVMYIVMGMGSFVIMFFGMITMAVATSTVSYDELDHGYLQIFSLPVSRRSYVCEKYVLILGMSILGIAVGFAAALISRALDPETAGTLEELFMTAAVAAAVIPAFSSFLIPLQLKYGSEKSRTAIFVAFAAIFIVIFTVVKNLPEGTGARLEAILDSASPAGILIAVLAFAALCIAGSFAVSLRVLQNKEF